MSNLGDPSGLTTGETPAREGSADPPAAATASGLPAGEAPPGPPAGEVRGRSRRRVIAIVVVVVALIAAGAFAVDQMVGGSSTPPPAAQTSTTTAAVQMTDLAETTPDSGTIGYASAETIVEPAGTASTALSQAQSMAASAQASVTADQQDLGDTASANGEAASTAQQTVSAGQATLAADSSTLAGDQATLTADEQKESVDCAGAAAGGAPASSPSGGSNPSGASNPSGGSSACSSDAAQVASDHRTVIADQQKVSGDQAAVQNDQSQLSSAEQHGTQGADQAQAKLAADQLALAAAQSALQQAQATATGYSQTSHYTALPAVGQVINPGQAMWSVDGVAVPLLAGTLNPWRAFSAGMAPGPDVAALDTALIAVGDGAGLAVSDTFTTATAIAIDRLQSSLGMPRTGALPIGSVIFEPTPVRVTTVHPQVGATVAGGGPVLDVTSTTAVVDVALPVGQTYLVKVGDPVSVDLPDGTTAAGTISQVGTVATSTSSNDQPGNNSPQATVNVTVSLTHASPAGSLDQAPVTVYITNAAAHDVLAVPTTALLALAGGGYAVEVVDAAGVHHLVAVTTGLFDDQAGLVQVSGGGLAAGQKVVVADS